MIKASSLNAQREHRTKATLHFDDENGVQQSHEVTVVFIGRSVAEGRKLRDILDAEGKYQFVDYCAAFVKSIPEIIGDDNQPVAITKEFLDTWTVENVQAIHNAVEKAIEGPNERPSGDSH